MSYDPHAPIRYDGKYRPEPALFDPLNGPPSMWLAVAYHDTGKNRTRTVHRFTRRGRHLPEQYPSEEVAQEACDRLNAKEAARETQSQRTA